MSLRKHTPGLLGLMASLLAFLLPIIGAIAVVNILTPPRPVTLTTHTTVVINGQTVLCTETLDPQTGARSRAC